MGKEPPDKGEGTDEQSVELQPVKMRIRGMPISTSLWANFADRWYEDALREARSNPKPAQKRDALRREIVFAVCFVESYLFEHVRNILSHDQEELAKYFPADKYPPRVRERWKDVCKLLFAQGHLKQSPSEPRFDDEVWRDFRELVDYRNGLVHAASSLPQVRGAKSPWEEPKPSPEDLDRELCGFAVRRVHALVTQLHSWLGTPPAHWLEKP